MRELLGERGRDVRAPRFLFAGKCDRDLPPLSLRDFADAFVLWLAYDRRPRTGTWLTLETIRYQKAVPLFFLKCVGLR